MQKNKTPLGRWMVKHGATVTGVARDVGITRARLYHYLHGNATPQLPILRRLMKLTGLPMDAFDFSDSHKGAA